MGVYLPEEYSPLWLDLMNILMIHIEMNGIHYCNIGRTYLSGSIVKFQW